MGSNARGSLGTDDERLPGVLPFIQNFDAVVHLLCSSILCLNFGYPGMLHVF